MFGILKSVFISTLISATSTLISVISMLSVYVLLTKCGAFARFWHVRRILVRLPDSGTFAGFWYVRQSGVRLLQLATLQNVLYLYVSSSVIKFIVDCNCSVSIYYLSLS